VVDEIAPVIAVLVAPDVERESSRFARDDGPARAAPIGLVLARCSVLLI